MLINWLQRLEPLFDEDGKSGAGGSPADGFSRLIERHGGSYEAAARLLYEEAYDHRRDKAALKSENETLKSKVPTEGTIILSSADKARWEAYQALGKPEEVTSKLQTAEAAMQERDALKRQGTIRQAAELYGYKPNVLERLLGETVPEFREVQVTRDGKTETVQQAVITNGDKVTPLDEYMPATYADFMPALKQGGIQQAPGVQLVPQVGTASGAAKSVLERYIEQRDKTAATRPNPLIPQQG